MENRINVITLSDYSEYIDGKHRNSGAYGYDEVFTYSPENHSFTYEWFSTCELTPDHEPSGAYSLAEVLAEMADFIRSNANTSNCTVYVNGAVVWTSTPIENTDIDTSDYFLED